MQLQQAWGGDGWNTTQAGTHPPTPTTQPTVNPDSQSAILAILRERCGALQPAPAPPPPRQPLLAAHAPGRLRRRPGRTGSLEVCVCVVVVRWGGALAEISLPRSSCMQLS